MHVHFCYGLNLHSFIKRSSLRCRCKR